MTTPGQMLRENCARCFGGKVTCSPCQGHGRVTCGACTGSGRLKVFDQLSVRFHHKVMKGVLDATGVPDHLIGQVRGDVVVDERRDIIDRCPAVAPEVDHQANTLLQKAREVNQAETIVLQQHLHIERVPINEVVYRYPDEKSPAQRLWIYGAEQTIHAPGAPTEWGRVLLVLGGVLLGLAAGIAALLLLL
jgi:hypothetical protein